MPEGGFKRSRGRPKKVKDGEDRYEITTLKT
jgi:hypothetical protein